MAPNVKVEWPEDAPAPYVTVKRTRNGTMRLTFADARAMALDVLRKVGVATEAIEKALEENDGSRSLAR